MAKRNKYDDVLPEKTLYFDIETMPCVALVWRPGYNIFVSSEAVLRPSWACLIQYKWKNEDKVHILSLTRDELLAGDDKHIWEAFIPVYNSANLVVTQNGKRFDVPWLQYRAMVHKLPSPLEQPQVDIKEQWARKFASPSNKLDWMGNTLFGQGKDPMSFGDWLAIHHGDMRAYKKMVTYGAKDVTLLQEVHKRCFPYLPRPPLVSPNMCPHCGSDKMYKNGTRISSMGRKQRQLCLKCGTASHYFIERWN